MSTSEVPDSLEDDLLFGLPPAVQELLGKLDQDQRVNLQAYLEIHNHLGEYPLHLVLAGLEELRPGTTDEIMGDSAVEAKTDRQNRRIAMLSEIAMKFGSLVVAWALAFFGAFHATKIMTQPGAGAMQVWSGIVILVFCIGGPTAAAAFARNSGVTIRSVPDDET